MNTLLTLLIVFGLQNGTDPKKESKTDQEETTSEIRMKLTDLLYDIEELMDADTVESSDITDQVRMSNDMLGALGKRNILRGADNEMISSYYKKVENNEMSQEDLQHYLKLMSNYTYGSAKSR